MAEIADIEINAVEEKAVKSEEAPELQQVVKPVVVAEIPKATDD